MRWSSKCVLLCGILSMILVRCVSAAVAEEDVQTLSQKIAASLVQGEAITLTVHALLPQSAGEVLALRRLLTRTLIQQRIRITGNPSNQPNVVVTLSQNWQGGLLVAEIQKDENRIVLIQPCHLTQPTLPTTSTKYSIQKELIWQQDAPILDLAKTGTRLLILEPAQIAVYSQDNRHWQLQQKISMPSGTVLPRDPRGRLALQGQLLTVFLPFLTCHANLDSSTSLSCEPGESEWPLIERLHFKLSGSISSGRNFFDSQVKLGSAELKTLLPFYSAAFIGDEKNATLLFTGQDGKVHLYSHELKSLGTLSGWGSEIADVESACDHQSLILATQPGDWAKADAIQAFKLIQTRGIVVSEPVPLSGPVMALWPSSDPTAALAIVKELDSGNYAAYQLSVSCQP